MAVVQQTNDNRTKVSFPRRIATYITSMNFAKVFRRQHPKRSTSPEKPSFLPHHHQYARPFSYHLPAKDQLARSSLMKTSPTVPYRVGLSSDSTLLNNGHNNENDEIVRLPIKNGRGTSPKARKDRRYQSQLNANKRWLFRSMETLDGWKGKVFPSKPRPSNSSQIRSRSVENLADENPNPSLFKQQRAVSPNRSIEGITNRVINAIGIHRQAAQSVPNIARSPALTIEKQSLLTRSTKAYQRSQPGNASAILDFRELSAFGFSHSTGLETRFNDENENDSLTPSENILNDVHLSDQENDEVTSSLSCLPNGYHPTNEDNQNELGDSWDFSITWIDSLKEQNSPQRKIQFYENLIKLLEQDTLTIDELLVLRKILAKIWPMDEGNSSNIDDYPPIFPTESKISGTRSLHAPEKVKQRSKLSTMTNHTAQRCSTIMEQATLLYEPLHEQNSGHTTKLASGLVAAKAKPCFIEDTSDREPPTTVEYNYPSHLNPFDERMDTAPSAPPPPPEDLKSNSNESIRRYFERLTLLETIYEKLNIESNKTPVQSNGHHQKPVTPEKTTGQLNYSQEKQNHENISSRRLTSTPSKSDTTKTVPNKFVEMNVDGTGSIRSSKSSIKRRAPTAPHISQHKNNPTMFTLSSADLNIPHRSDSDIHIPIQIQSSKEKYPIEVVANDATASCDDDGHIFVYDPPDHREEPPADSPKKTERIQQWLSTCETKPQEIPASRSLSPNSQYKMRCVAKATRHPSPPQQFQPEKNILPSANNAVEPGRYRTSLKIQLETNEPTHPRSRAASATSKSHSRQIPIFNEHHDIPDEKYFSRNPLPPNGLQRDHQAVYL